MKQKIKESWDWFDWGLFKWVTEFTEDELHAMPERLFRFERRIYDIFMLLFMFTGFTYAAALIYEGMSYAAMRTIPPNFIQLAPLVMMTIITGLMFFAGNLREKNYEYLTGKGHRKDQGQLPGRSNNIPGLSATDVLVLSLGKT